MKRDERLGERDGLLKEIGVLVKECVVKLEGWVAKLVASQVARAAL